MEEIIKSIKERWNTKGEKSNGTRSIQKEDSKWESHGVDVDI